MIINHKSIFNKYFENTEFVDRFKESSEQAVDIIIPLINTNELWIQNLYSFYREIPINNLLIGDGGCTDDTINVLKDFPRVKVFDQHKYKSQGYAIKELMLNVSTEYFIYLHADVFLPDGWFDIMYAHKDNYSWFECKRQMTILYEYPALDQHSQERAYSGSQFGRSDIMKSVIDGVVDDDFLQRNEDIIFMELIKSAGGSYGKISETYHYHQVTNKEGEKEPDIKSVSIINNSDPEWETRIFNMQYKGIIKYLSPKMYLIDNVYLSILKLVKLNRFNWKEFRSWVKTVNPEWLRYISRRGFYYYQFKSVLKGFAVVVASNTSFGNALKKAIKR